jgi:3-phosphoinositide dependent protein kinase-1
MVSTPISKRTQSNHLDLTCPITQSRALGRKTNSEDHKVHRVADYDKLRTIGKGSYGSVSEVKERSTQQVFAIKIMSKELLSQEGKFEQARAERVAMTELRHHPNIIKLFRCFQDRHSLYFVTELAVRGDLQKALERHTRLDRTTAVPLLGQVLLALAYMHRQEVIHRDLKPANILLDSKNRVKVSDFGCAKVGKAHESDGKLVGSPAYISPEVLAKKPATAASDLWAFGCIVYTMFVGQAPFNAGSSHLTFEKIRGGEYDIPSFVPNDAADLIRRLLVADPAERIGAGTAKDGYLPIRSHPLFAPIIDWDALPHQEIALVGAPRRDSLQEIVIRPQLHR